MIGEDFTTIMIEETDTMETIVGMTIIVVEVGAEGMVEAADGAMMIVEEDTTMGSTIVHHL